MGQYCDASDSPAPFEISVEANSAFKSISAMATSLYENSIDDPAYVEYLSPFLFQVLYQSASMLITMNSKHPDMHNNGRIKSVKTLLQLLDKRWKVAGGSIIQYLADFRI
jgi:hypothetical protein